MFCIATFIVFAILAIFSASFRPLAAKAWHCVLRRITFRPCDISFSEEMKGKLLGKIIFTHPKLAKFIDKWIDWISFMFVLLSIWSLLYVANAGLNLWVYDTCNPQTAESCSLSGEACGINQEDLGLIQSVQEGRLIEWGTGPFVRFAETIVRIPDRVKKWNTEEYLSSTATFYTPEDASRPYAIEVIDPGCVFCKKLTKNLKDAGAMQAVNVSYVLYPILNPDTGTYKFPHSYIIASYLEAVKLSPLAGNSSLPEDWQLLEKIFAEPITNETDIQSKLNISLTTEEAIATVHVFLQEIGYTATEVEQIATDANSKTVQASLRAQKEIVENDIRTIKIPTLLFDTRRFDRVIDVEKIQSLL